MLTGLVTSCGETLKKHVIEGMMGRQGEEEDAGIYWMTVRKREYTGTSKKKHQIALCGEQAWYEATDLAQDRLHYEFYDYGHGIVGSYIVRS